MNLKGKRLSGGYDNKITVTVSVPVVILRLHVGARRCGRRRPSLTAPAQTHATADARARRTRYAVRGTRCTLLARPTRTSRLAAGARGQYDDGNWITLEHVAARRPRRSSGSHGARKQTHLMRGPRSLPTLHCGTALSSARPARWR